MQLPKSVRRAISRDYQAYRDQLKSFEKAVPKGAPSVLKPGSKPVGPNCYESLPAEKRAGLSPDYPVQYSFEVESMEKGVLGLKPGSKTSRALEKTGIFRPTRGNRATGTKATLTTGPGLLPPEYRVPGRFDYSAIPDLSVIPIEGQRRGGHAEGARSSSSMTHRPPTGLPADPETGRPILPRLERGSYRLEEEMPRPRPAAPVRQRAARRTSLDSLELP